MKGPSIFKSALPLLLAIVIALNVPQTQALSVEETCQIVKNGTFIADPAGCQNWAYCLNGQPIYGKCGEGYLYDSASGVCDYPDRVQCSTNVTTMCTGLTNVYKANPYSCQNYCYCYEGTTYCEDCPLGQYFNPATTQCIWSDDSNCDASSPCILAQNGFVKDVSSCDGWNRCASGQIVASGLCPSGFYFNAFTSSCDYPANVPCSASPATPAPGGPTPAPGICTGITKGFVADGSTCRGYFFCVNGVSQGWGQCPKGSQFNVGDQMCTDPNTALCTFDRCDGTTQDFMAVANSNCQKYYICKNGVSNGQAQCRSDFPYFNELAQVCQTTPLTYPICTEAVPVPAK